jgi:hypothetical protein
MNFDNTKHYLGKLCRHNHEIEGKSLRYLSTNFCVECQKNHYLKNREKRLEKLREYSRSYYHKNIEKWKKYRSKYILKKINDYLLRL